MDTSGENSATRMGPYMVGKVSSIAFCILDDHTVVDTLADILGYMNDQRNKGVHRGAGISATAGRHDLGGVSGPTEEILQSSSLSSPSDTHDI
jgi:hypothetical protein